MNADAVVLLSHWISHQPENKVFLLRRVVGSAGATGSAGRFATRYICNARDE